MNVPLKCLLVEDSEDDAQLMLHRLRAGFEVSATRVDNAQALTAALDGPPWDIVISDYRMPGFSGIEALALVRGRDSDLPFILVSGQMGEELAVEAMRAGANDYLTKEHLYRLAPAVQRTLQEAATRRTHRLAEAALRANSTRHEAILKSALDGYWLVDSSARIVEVNDAYARMSGYRIDELLSMRIVDLEDSESSADTAEHMQEIQQLGYDRFETRHRRKDGSIYDVEVSAQRIGDDNGLIVGFLRDITERNRAIAALRASEAQLRLVTDVAPISIAQNDRDRRYRFVNRAYAQMFGLQPHELIGKHAREVLGEAVYAEAEPYIEAVLAGECGEYDLEVPAGDAEPRAMHVSFAPELGASGEVVGYVATVLDISSRKRAEQALLASNRHLKATLDASPDLFFEMGLDGRYYDYHSPRHDLLVLPSEQMLGHLVTEVLPAEAAQTVLAALQEAHEQQTSTGKQMQIQLPGGQAWFELSVARKATAAGEPPRFVVLSRDITARKQTEAADAFLAQAGVDANGEPFFQALARFLATSLQMDYICIDRLEGDQLTATTLAVWHDGGFEDNLQYALADTPCGQVPEQTICCYPAGVTTFFPRDAALQELRAESYIGVPLQSHSNIAIGLIAAISRRPLINRAQAEALLTRVAPRAAAELERLSAEAALRSSHAVLSKFNALAVGRELRMIELKREINELCAQLGKPLRHQIAVTMPAGADPG
jgi:PAS domain S-box-containing protein